MSGFRAETKGQLSAPSANHPDGTRQNSRKIDPVCGELLISPESAIRHTQDADALEVLHFLHQDVYLADLPVAVCRVAVEEHGVRLVPEEHRIAFRSLAENRNNTRRFQQGGRSATLVTLKIAASTNLCCEYPTK